MPQGSLRPRRPALISEMEADYKARTQFEDRRKVRAQDVRNAQITRRRAENIRDMRKAVEHGKGFGKNKNKNPFSKALGTEV